MTAVAPNQEHSLSATPMMPLPTRVALASEAFSGAIDYLMPEARTEYVDIPQGEMVPLVNGYYAGDATADALVAAIRTSGGKARTQFDQALEHGIESVLDPLPEVVAFIKTVDTPPTWIDAGRVEIGLRAVRRIDGATFMGTSWAMGFLLAAILPNSARSMTSNSRAVQNSGRRFAETGKLGLDVIDLNGLSRFGAGTKSSSRLRVLHATVRAHLRKRGDWDESVYGAPISATDILGASLVTLTVVMAAERAGYRFSPRELDGIGHYVALSAYRLGTPAELIPQTIAGQRRAFYLLLRSARGRADQASTGALMPALVNIDIPDIPKVARPAVRSIFNAYGRLIFGDQLSTATGIPNSQLRRVVPLAGAIIRPFEALRSRSHLVDLATDKGADLVWTKLMPLIINDEATYDASHVEMVVQA
jgi:hypothetical protein